MDILEFIQENFAVIVPVLWILGMFLKRTPLIPDWTIPWILTVLSIVLSCGISQGFSFDAVIQGILAAGGAVLVHQLGKQTKNKDDDKLAA